MTETEARVARRVRITGKVQGVWFRAWTVQQATELGLDGWVRNRLDGSVEALVSGAPAKVEAFIERCHSGSPASRVDRVEVEGTPGIVAAGFTQKPTV
ncbi:acylphosphatase [Rhizorhabdus sp. FW153]|uniref:acylphosphatase n=1 Tax=Rhizorhabdus sp. FW153 TaxID=3400216 RepID=UPI003CF89458